MIRKYNHLLYSIVTVWFLLTQSLPPFNLIMPFTGIVQVAIFVGVILLLYPSLLITRRVVVMLIYGLMTLIYFFMGNKFYPIINAVIVPFLFMISGLLISEYTFKYDKSFKYTKLVLITVLVCNVIMSVITIPQFSVNPNIVYGTTVNRGMSESDRQMFSFVISYQTVHGIAIIMAPIAFFCKKLFYRNKKYCFLLSVASLLLLYVTYKSNSTTAMLLSLLMTGVGLLIKLKKLDRRSIVHFVLLGSLGFILIQPGVVIPLLKTIQSTMDTNSGNYKKLDEVQTKILFGESSGDLQLREERYNSSTTLFLESPLTGTASPEKIGMHSFILDRLALFGLIFIIPLLLVFLYHYKSAYRQLNHTRVIYAFSVAGMLVMLYMKNDFEQGTWLYGFAYLPLLCRYIDFQIDKKYLK